MNHKYIIPPNYINIIFTNGYKGQTKNNNNVMKTIENDYSERELIIIKIIL